MRRLKHCSGIGEQKRIPRYQILPEFVRRLPWQLLWISIKLYDLWPHAACIPSRTAPLFDLFKPRHVLHLLNILFGVSFFQTAVKSIRFCYVLLPFDDFFLDFLFKWIKQSLIVRDNLVNLLIQLVCFLNYRLLLNVYSHWIALRLVYYGVDRTFAYKVHWVVDVSGIQAMVIRSELLPWSIFWRWSQLTLNFEQYSTAAQCQRFFIRLLKILRAVDIFIIYK